jgi:hypothetical protein
VANKDLLRDWFAQKGEDHYAYHLRRMGLSRAELAAIIAGGTPTSTQQQSIQRWTTKRPHGRPILASEWWSPNSISTGRVFWAEAAEMAGAGTLTGVNNRYTGTGTAIGAFTATGSPARSAVDNDYPGGVSFQLLEASTQYITAAGAVGDYVASCNGAANGWTFCGIDKITDAADNAQLLFALSNTTGTSKGAFLRWRNTGDIQVGASNATTQFIDSETTGGPAPANVVFDWCFWIGADLTPGVGATGTNDWELWINGVLRLSGELGASDAWGAANPAGVPRYGSRSPAYAASDAFEGTKGGLVFMAEGKHVSDIVPYMRGLRGL